MSEIDTSRENIERIIGAAPYACSTGGVNKMVASLRALLAERDALRKELQDVLDWALTEKKPLRDQEIASIRAALGGPNERR